MSLPVHVISLQRTPERRAAFEEMNRGLSYRFVDAIDGRELDRNSPLAIAHVAPDLQHYTRGGVGCALSHRSLWDLADRENRAVTIAEDDAILRADFEVRSREAMDRLPTDWDIVLWGWNFDSLLSLNAMPGISHCVMIFDQARLRQSIPAFRSMAAEPHLFRLDKCFGCCCYTISPAGARKFKAHCFPLRNHQVFFPAMNKNIQNFGIDVAMSGLYAQAQSFVAFPPLAVSKNEREVSTIQTPPAAPAS